MDFAILHVCLLIEQITFFVTYIAVNISFSISCDHLMCSLCKSNDVSIFFSL